MTIVASLLVASLGADEGLAQPVELAALGGVPPPLPDLTGLLKDRDWALVLGKALFFDQQVGSDGQACASCHFSAGADSRVKNQLAPGPDKKFGGTFPLQQIGLTSGGQLAGPNITMAEDDFPFHELADPADRNTAILFTTNDRMSSQGVFPAQFVGFAPGQSGLEETCAPVDDPVFHVGGKEVRRVEPRNTPTNINAVFNHRSFWDGRANNRFNGVDPFGRRSVKSDPRARVVVRKTNGQMALQALDLKNSSLASQAVGPPTNTFEMSCGGRSFADVARKMLSRQPLGLQAIDQLDSVFGQEGELGDLRAPGGQGLAVTYGFLIEQAFESKYWSDTEKRSINAQGQLVLDPAGFVQRELNFSMFFGIAVMLYEATLVSDETPLDHFLGCSSPSCSSPEAPNPAALTAQEQAGRQIFAGKGKCINCHGGPLLSNAAFVNQNGGFDEDQVVERMIMGDGGVALYDDGFYDIGVTPAKEDLGVGGADPFGNPLSFSRQFVRHLRFGVSPIDPFQVDPCKLDVPFNPQSCSLLPTSAAALAKLRVAVDGAFKVPGLRNVGMTAPYFHNGGAATLDQVIEFYDRGGNRRGQNGNDTTGTGPLGDGVITNPQARGSNLDPDIQRLFLTAQEKANLKAFLLALSDERVACRRAPFDGPELRVTNGHKAVDVNPADGRLDDELLTVPATGKNGLGPDDCLPNTGNLFDLAPQ